MFDVFYFCRQTGDFEIRNGNLLILILDAEICMAPENVISIENLYRNLFVFAV